MTALRHMSSPPIRLSSPVDSCWYCTEYTYSMVDPISALITISCIFSVFDIFAVEQYLAIYSNTPLARVGYRANEMNWNELNTTAGLFASCSPCNARELTFQFSLVQFSFVALYTSLDFCVVLRQCRLEMFCDHRRSPSTATSWSGWKSGWMDALNYGLLENCRNVFFLPENFRPNKSLKSVAESPPPNFGSLLSICSCLSEFWRKFVYDWPTYGT